MEFTPEMIARHGLEFASSCFFCPIERWRIHLQCRAALPTKYAFCDLVEHDRGIQYRTLPLLCILRKLRSNVREGSIKLAKVLGIPFSPWMVKVLETVVLFPLAHLRTAMVADVPGDMSVRSFFNMGAMGLWRGVSLSMPQCFRYQAAYSRAIHYLEKKSPWQDGIKGSISHLGIVSLSSLVGGFITYPFDTMVRRLQVRAIFGTPRTLMEEIRWTFASSGNALSLYDGYMLEFLQSIACTAALMGAAVIVKYIEKHPEILEMFEANVIRRTARRR